MTCTQIKISVIGAECTGKTVLCNAITDGKIESEYIPTIGIDCIVKYTSEKKLFLWDLAGAQRFEDIITFYIKSVDVLLFCYSSESYESFLKMRNKHDVFLEQIKDQHIIIVAT